MPNKLSILYVEDEEVLRVNTSRALSRLCSELFIANDGEEGLELYKQHQPDIVITDINMPKKNGLDMVKDIKDMKPKQHVVFITAHGDNDYFMQAIELHVDGYLLKPLDYKFLKNKIAYIKEHIDVKKQVVYQHELIKEIAQLQDNILLVLDGDKQVVFSNRKFLTYFEVESLEEFNIKYEEQINSYFDKDIKNTSIALGDNQSREFFAEFIYLQNSPHLIVTLRKL